MVIHKPRTLLWQLGLALMAMQAAAVVLLGWYAASTFERFTHDQTVAELQRLTPLVTERLTSVLERLDAQRNRAEIDRIVKEDGQRSGVRLTLIDLDGTVIADSDADPSRLENHLQRPEVQAALHGHAESAVRHSVSTQHDTMYLAQVLQINGEPRAIVRAALALETVNAAPARVMRLIGAAAAVSLLFTLAVILLVSRQLSRTVSRLALGAQQYASGDLAHRITKPASHELAVLADALNHMAEQLNEQIDLLRQQRSEQQAIHQSMSNGMIALDLNQSVISINRAAERMLGLQGDSARSRLIQELLREPELNRFVAEAVADRAPAMAEFQLRRHAGATVQVSSEPLRNAREQRVGILVFITDVTQLRKLESIRSDFAANVSHELRTPITNIKGYVETMLEVGVDDREQTRRFLEVINRNTKRLASIIEDLLALARLEQPDAPTTLERIFVPLRRIVESATTELQSECASKGTRIQINIPAEVTVSVNPHLLEQAVGNLLSNAIKYSPGGTTVTVEAIAQNDHEIAISVTDEGPGIPAEHLSRIFERFYRVDRARSREVGGTGLGLSIVKHIALVHGGRVDVQSEVGRGSVFRIVLPIG